MGMLSAAETLLSNSYEYDDHGRPIPPKIEEIEMLPSDGGKLWNRT